MERMNQFIVSNYSTLQKFLEKISSPTADATEKPIQLPKNLKENSLARMWKQDMKY